MSNSLRPHGTVAYQAPQSMEFSRQEYWSGLPFSSGTRRLKPGLLYCRQTLYHLSHQGSPWKMKTYTTPEKFSVVNKVTTTLGFPGGSDSKESSDSKALLPGESPWTEEPGGLQSMGSQRVRHNWATKHRELLGHTLSPYWTQVHLPNSQQSQSTDEGCSEGK